jgi:hypothetical protein
MIINIEYNSLFKANNANNRRCFLKRLKIITLSFLKVKGQKAISHLKKTCFEKIYNFKHRK